MRRKTNFVIALLAMVAMLASCKPDPAPTVKAWDGSVDKAWYNESAASFEISKASELAGLASLVNEGTTFEGKSLILKSDLDLANLEWTPIGQKAGNKFAGSFDGQNHAISNLKITPNEAIAKEDTFDGYAALFGAMDGGTIKNVKVSGSVEGKNVAGLLARMDSGLVENCISYVAVVGTGKAGGIVCLTNNMGCTIQNCSNEGDVSGKTTGGVGGIAAYVNNKSKIDSCLNNGKIGTSSDKYSGGIAGYVTKGPDIKISNCENKGVIVANEQAGGIVGITTDISSIENCKNSGNVSAGDTGMAGGIAGSTSQSTVKKCSNTASVHGRYAGGVIGNDAYSTIDNCSGGKAAITSPAHSIGFTGHSFKMEVPENGSSGRILGSHQGAGPGKYTILILSSESDDDNTLGTIGICGYTTTMPLLKITSGTFYGDPLAGNGSTIILEEGASWGGREAGAYCRGGVEESTRIAVWTLQ